MAKKKMVNKNMMNKKTVKPDSTLAIVGLILTILGVLPGLWAIIAGPKYRTAGIIQLVFTLISFPLMFVLIGFPLAFAMWIWAIVTMVHVYQDSQ